MRTLHSIHIDLVNVATELPTVVLDICYATPHNFTGKQLYPVARCYIRACIAEKLKKVQQELQLMGLGLKIWDGYRPLDVQKIFWTIMSDERYVADPVKGSRHNRGAALDLTLIDLITGTELLMPTLFDDFSEKAHRDYMDLPIAAIKNRELLQTVMTKHGFVGLPTEWWHFDDDNWQQYELLNIAFTDLPL